MSFETNYHPLPYQDNGDDNIPENEVMIHVVPESSKSRWNHIDDLDSFFTRVYQYHQNHGFKCITIKEVLELAQFAFMVLFSTFLIECVDYPVLFHDKVLPFSIPTYNSTGRKVTLNDAIVPIGQCVNNFNWAIIICLLVAFIVWFLRAIRVFGNILKNHEMKAFYSTALKIFENELDNMTWHEVQRRMQEVQREQQMCIHKQELTELDIYHRILRNKNYMVAMINKDLIPVKFSVPFIGTVVYFTNGFKFNLELLLFRGPLALFYKWRLKEDFKKHSKRLELAKRLELNIWILFAVNLLLSPLILLWHILNVFFNYADQIKREPSFLGSRRWSNFARLDLRHFNELDHELNARLNRAYNCSTRYVNSFNSFIVTILSQNAIFFAGSILGALIVLTVIDEDVLQVNHVLTIMTGLGTLLAVCRSFIPDENMVRRPEKLMYSILANTHYMPDNWKGNAHTTQVRDEFTQLFQYKIVFLIYELLSPILTPLILLLYLRPKSLDIIDFYRNFTVEVVGVGDVCSFALMDVKKHGHPQWLTDEKMTEANQYGQAENGKTELSLMHFTLTNPEWKPPAHSVAYISKLREHAQRNTETLPFLHEENPFFLSSSMSSTETSYYQSFGGMYHRLQNQSRYTTSQNLQEAGPSTADSLAHSVRSGSTVMRGAINRTEGPAEARANGLLASVHPTIFTNNTSRLMPNYDVVPTEFTSADMSFSALYMHELHHQIARSYNYTDMLNRSMWHGHEMSDIKESNDEEEEITESIPLLDTKLTI